MRVMAYFGASGHAERAPRLVLESDNIINSGLWYPFQARAAPIILIAAATAAASTDAFGGEHSSGFGMGVGIAGSGDGSASR